MHLKVSFDLLGEAMPPNETDPQHELWSYGFGKNCKTVGVRTSWRRGPSLGQRISIHISGVRTA